MTKYSLVMSPTPCKVAGGIISIRPTYSCNRALTYLLKQNNQCFLAIGLWSTSCPKKGTNSILGITSSNTDRFSFLFTFTISWKFAVKLGICIHTLSIGGTEIDYLEGQQFIISSFQEWANAMSRRPSSVRPSVRLSVNFCANRFFSQANGQIATKLAHDGLQVSMHPWCALGQGQGQKSRDTRTFLDSWNELIRHWWSGFYSAMHFSAKRGLAIACRPSVCPSVCDVGGLW